MYFSNYQLFKHSFNTPVTTILCNVELALRCVRQDCAASGRVKPQSHKTNYAYYLNRALLSAKYLQSILQVKENETGNKNQNNKKNKQSFFIRQAIQEVLIIAKRPNTQAQLISYYDLDDKLKIKGHKLYFQEALICILNNAFEAYGEFVANKLVVLSANVKEKQVELSITDAGCGMNWLRQKVAVLPGVSAKKSHQGVGLAFAKKVICTQLNGKFFIDSKVKKGTRIQIILPVC